MKKLIGLLFVLISMSAFAETRIKGAGAEMLFNELEDQFEYKYGANVQGLSIQTIVRHDESVSCSKETVTYTNSNRPAEINFECIIK